jgi:hypothetical protein
MRSRPKPPETPSELDPRAESEDPYRERTVFFAEERTTIVPAREVAAYARRHGADSALATMDAASARHSTIRPAGTSTEAVDPDADSDPLERVMFEHLAIKDYAAALIVAESMLEQDPAHRKARLCRDKCLVLLEHKYVACLGSLKSVLVANLGEPQLRSLTLDHRAAFLLSLIDGATDIDTLLDLSAMPRLEALRLIYELSLEGVIGCR